MQQPGETPLDAIRSRTSAILREVVGSPRAVALVDFPLHQNSGDSLIWLGTVRYLDDLGYDIRYRADRARFRIDDLDRMLGSGPVLFHGGGNLGDLWPEHQEFRHSAIGRLGGRKVVVLSQSIWFADGDNARRANAVLGRHPDLTVLIRDPASLARAERDLPDVRVRFCPDLALGARPTRESAPVVDVVGIDRADHEASEGVPCRPGWAVTDWGLGGADRLRWAWVRARYAAAVRPPTSALRPWRAGLQPLYDPIAAMNVRSAIRTIERGRVVVTNRLHAHVLASLLGIPNVVIDNSYGKISEVHRHYSGSIFAGSTLVRSPQEVAPAVTALLTRLPA